MRSYLFALLFVTLGLLELVFGEAILAVDTNSLPDRAFAAIIAYNPLVIIALGVLLVLEGIRARNSANRQILNEKLLDEVRAQISTLENALRQSQEQLTGLRREGAQQQRELEKNIADKAVLQTAVTAAEAKIRELEAKTNAAARPEEVQAEIVNFLSVLQDKGRFIDFLMDDVSQYDDERVAAAARVVHQGCASVIREHFKINPVYTGSEGETITLEKDYSPALFRLTGRAGTEPPFQGQVLHKGWKASAITLPKVVVSPQSPSAQGVIAPADVEVH